MICVKYGMPFLCSQTGCQWRMLPSDFAPWELVYYYRKWSSWGEFDLLLNNLRESTCVKMGQKKAEASLGIMDSQSVRWGDHRL